MRIAIRLAAIVIPVAGAAAQTPSFKSGVTMIQVPVVVRDHDGHVVGNLAKDDFQLFDNGKRVEIAGFSIEKPGAQVIPDRSLPDPSSAGAQPAGAPAMDVPEHFIAYFFDDLGIRDPGDLSRIRDAAARQAGALQPGDRAAIVTSSCKVQLDFTNDRAKLQEAVARLELRPSALCRVGPIQVLQIEVLKNVVKRMATLPGRREIILISSGFFVGHDRSQEPVALIDAAIRSKVVIDAVDLGESTEYAGTTGGAQDQRFNQQPRYVNPANPIVLTDLAHGTGGTCVVGNDFATSFRKLATPESHYVLSFAPTGADGRFHQLKVKLENEHKLKVEARGGYYASAQPE